jgi:hypothetical protein
MNPTRRLITTAVGLSCLLGLSRAVQAQDKGKGKAKGKANHHSGAKLVGDKIKSNGHHVLEKKGPHTVSVEVKDGKIAGMRVKHDKKGELPVKKYKTKRKMAQASSGFQYASYIQAQDQYLGTTYIGYAYYDDWGDEYIYWYPYDMILDGDTGAVEYVAAY